MGDKVIAFHARLAVDVSSIAQRAQQRRGGPLRQRDIHVPEMQQLQRVAGGFLYGDIPRDGGHQLQVKLRGKQGSGNGGGIVDTRIGIQNNGQAHVSSIKR